jgi:flavorubredoxin
MGEQLKAAGIEVVLEPLRIQYAPTAAELAQCAAFGAQFADALRARAGADPAQ